MELDEYFSYRSCMHCSHAAYDMGKRKYYCKLLHKDIGGNYEVHKPTECDKWRNIQDDNTGWLY